VLNDALAVVEHAVRASPGERIQVMPRSTFKLPLNYPNVKETCVVSEGYTNLPEGVDPFTEAHEKLIVSSLFGNLHDMLAVDIDTDPVTTRTSANSVKECEDFLVIGGSHAGRLVEQMNELGASCRLISLPNYRASAIHVGKLAACLEGMAVSTATTLVLQIMDNAFFMDATEEGGLIPLSKTADGKYHCFGDLAFTPKEMQWKLMQQAAKEISHLKANKLVILAPLPRYLEEGCCENKEHMPNRAEPDFRKKMEDHVFQCRASIKDFAFRLGFKRSKTISTWGIVRKAGAEWADQVHLSAGGYRTLAKEVIETSKSVGCKRPASEDAGQPAKKPRTETRGSAAAAAAAVNNQRGRGGALPGNSAGTSTWSGNYRGRGWFTRGTTWTRGQQPRRGTYRRSYN
jgi:hypothetical protein